MSAAPRDRFGHVDCFGDAKSVVHAVIEIPSGSRNKFKVGEVQGLIRLDRYLSASCHYPMDYGFIPQTLATDGEALDVMVLVREPTFPGCLIDARVLGQLRIRDAAGWDIKILAVPDGDPLFNGMKKLVDVPRAYLDEVEHFFTTYKALEGAEETSFGWSSAAAALAEVRRCHRAYGSSPG